MAKTVAYGWAGAIMQVKLPIGVFSHCVTDGRTGRWTDGWTDGWRDGPMDREMQKWMDGQGD